MEDAPDRHLGLFVTPNNNNGKEPFVYARLKQQRHVNHLYHHILHIASVNSVIDVQHHYCFTSQPGVEDLFGQFDEYREMCCLVQLFSGGFVFEDDTRQQNTINVAYHEEQLPSGKHEIDGTIRQQDIFSKRFNHAFVSPAPLVETNAISYAGDSRISVRVEQLVVRFGRSL